jgi:hypothetical protein
MREIRTSGSMSEKWRRSTAVNMRHRQPKGPATARLSLTHRATSRLYVRREGVVVQWVRIPPGKWSFQPVAVRVLAEVTMP